MALQPLNPVHGEGSPRWGNRVQKADIIHLMDYVTVAGLHLVILPKVIYHVLIWVSNPPRRNSGDIF